MKLLFYLTTLFIALTINAQNPINTNIDPVYIADARIQIHDLKNLTSVFIDSSNKLTIQDLASGKFNNRFQPFPGETQFVAQPYITYWLKLTLRTSDDIHNWWLLLYSNSEIGETIQHGYVDAWFIDRNNQATEHQRTGVLVPRS